MFHICKLVKLLYKQQRYVIQYKGVQISKLPEVARLVEMRIFGMWFLIFFYGYYFHFFGVVMWFARKSLWIAYVAIHEDLYTEFFPITFKVKLALIFRYFFDTRTAWHEVKFLKSSLNKQFLFFGISVDPNFGAGRQPSDVGWADWKCLVRRRDKKMGKNVKVNILIFSLLNVLDYQS